MSDGSPQPDAEDQHTPSGVLLEVRHGSVHIVAEGPAAGTAELSWPDGHVRVHLFNEQVETTSCRVPGTAQLRVEPIQQAARNRYVVSVSRDRMEATLRVVSEPGFVRTIDDAPGSSRLRLQVHEECVQPPAPTIAEAYAELQRSGVTYGVDEARIFEAIETPGEEVMVAVGLEPMEGRSGYLEQLVDFEALRYVGVLAETPLLCRVRKREGVPGRDVTGRELSVPAVKDVRIKPGPGVAVDEQGIMAIATVDGAPRLDGDGRIEVRHELVIEVVDPVSGDIEFNGSVRVEGDVGEGRRVIARDEILVEGNVDRALLESGGSIRVQGSIMSSVLRAGGERAVAATIADRVVDLPKQLGIVAAQARQLRDQGAKKGTTISHGLSIQMVLENFHRGVLPALQSVVGDLREAGPNHAGAAGRAGRWYRQLSTAANISLTPEQYQEILVELGALVSDVQRAIDEPADLVVSYMQASEAEATGVVTLTGKGIFNSRIVAWGGLEAQHYEAVLRGGSILSHGKMHVREVGSPAGARTGVQLVVGGSLEADRVFAGTVITGPGYTHRFVGDRSCVKVGFDDGGSMNVESLAA